MPLFPFARFFDADKFFVKDIDIRLCTNEIRFVNSIKHKHFVAAAVRFDAVGIAGEVKCIGRIRCHVVETVVDFKFVEIKSFPKESRKVLHPLSA